MYFSLLGELCILFVTFPLFILSLYSFTNSHEESWIANTNANFSILTLSFIIGFFSGIFLKLQSVPIAVISFSTLILLFNIVNSYLSDRVFVKIKMPVILFLLSGCLTLTAYMKIPSIKIYPEQKFYEDKVVFHRRTNRHDLTIIQWKKYYWLFIDGLKNLSSADDYLFYEPFIHPAVRLCESPKKVLILGGENGCAVRELLKYPSLTEIDVLPYDTAYLNIARNNPIFLRINNSSLLNKKVHIIRNSIEDYLINPANNYDLVVVDLPDPRSLEYNQFYTVKFYELCKSLLSENGVLVTQAGSPFYAPEAFVAIRNTIKKSGFSVIPLHNQVMTLSEWGWIIGMKNFRHGSEKINIDSMEFSSIKTRWLDREAMELITHFGKSPDFSDTVSVNTLSDPVVFKDYTERVKELEGP